MVKLTAEYLGRCMRAQGRAADAREAALRAVNADLLVACETTANRPLQAQEMMRREGFVIDDLEDRWQKLAFTLYTYLAENATQAEAAIAKAKAD